MRLHYDRFFSYHFPFPVIGFFRAHVSSFPLSNPPSPPVLQIPMQSPSDLLLCSAQRVFLTLLGLGCSPPLLELMNVQCVEGFRIMSAQNGSVVSLVSAWVVLGWFGFPAFFPSLHVCMIYGYLQWFVNLEDVYGGGRNGRFVVLFLSFRIGCGFVLVLNSY
ncbi:hypothetical protein C8R42DRAFT_658156 [Lentinula raphanica]|nr:hypothetical protein C8R42DRAFT_658156 [Lentinula raphanica]